MEKTKKAPIWQQLLVSLAVAAVGGGIGIPLFRLVGNVIVPMVLTGLLMMAAALVYYKAAKRRTNIVLTILTPVLFTVADMFLFRAVPFGLYMKAVRYGVLFLGSFLTLLCGRLTGLTDNPAKKEIAMAIILVVLGIVYEILIFGAGMYELAWLGGIVEFLAIFWCIRLPGVALRKKFAQLGNFGGMTYQQIAAAVGPCSAETATVMADGKTAVVRQWIRTGYHISLVFDGDVCLGKNHEGSV